MSHLHLRKEDNCLNCGTQVIGRYCHNCGQENVEVKESAWHFIVHFFNDITHFDGKFFTTVKDLLFKPGFLSREYMEGKRMRYLNPIRMYLFTSFIFFLVFFAVVHINEIRMEPDKFTVKGKSRAELAQMPYEEFDEFTAQFNNGKPMIRGDFNHFMDSLELTRGVYFFGKKYQSRSEYDSLIAAGKIKENWFGKMMVRKGIEFNNKYRNDQGQTLKAFAELLMHQFPKMLFISLPFVALLLKLLYIRKKQFYFVSHGIFTLHFYIFVFIAMLLSIGISKLQSLPNMDWLSYVNGLLTVAIFFYLYKAMRNFYQQTRGRTILKYFLFLGSFLLLIIFLFILFIFISFLQV